MSDNYLRLDCIIMKWNKPIPAVFLIDPDSKSTQTAVYDKGNYRSLDNKKGRGPRPLRTHAYNFSRIDDENGKTLIAERADNAAKAAAFAGTMLAAAVGITRNEYFSELERIIWPGMYEESSAPTRMYLKGSALVGHLPPMESKLAYRHADYSTDKPLSLPLRDQMVSNDDEPSKEPDATKLPPDAQGALGDDIREVAFNRIKRRGLMLELMDVIEDLGIQELDSIIKYAKQLR